MSSADPSTGDRLVEIVSRPLFVWALVVLMWMSLIAANPPADPDLFARVAVGRLIDVAGGVVDQEPFAFTPLLKERWIDHEWLSGVVLWDVARLGGDLGLVAFSWLMMAATAGLIVRSQVEYSGRTSAGWSVLTLAHVFGVWFSMVRSRVFTFLFVGYLLFALVRWMDGRRGWIWALPPIFVFWANAHGGFVAGLGLLGAAAVGASLRSPRESVSLWLCLGACLLATLINPYGLEYWAYILEATAMERELIVEWRTPLYWQFLLVGIVAAFFVAGAWLRRASHRVRPEVWMLLAAALWAASDAQRLVHFPLVVLATFGVAEYRAVIDRVRPMLPGSYPRAARHVAAGASLLAGVGLAGTVAWQLGRTLDTGLSFDRYPVSAIHWLEQYGAGGRVVTHFNDGSFALWRLYPDYRVAIDGRYEETYQDSAIHVAYEALDPRREDHERSLARLDPDYIVLPPGMKATLDDFDARWQVVYEDSATAVLAREGLPVRTRPRPLRPMWEPAF